MNVVKKIFTLKKEGNTKKEIIETKKTYKHGKDLNETVDQTGEGTAL
jgi:hypothetical protein